MERVGSAQDPQARELVSSHIPPHFPSQSPLQVSVGGKGRDMGSTSGNPTASGGGHSGAEESEKLNGEEEKIEGYELTCTMMNFSQQTAQAEEGKMLSEGGRVMEYSQAFLAKAKLMLAEGACQMDAQTAHTRCAAAATDKDERIQEHELVNHALLSSLKKAMEDKGKLWDLHIKLLKEFGDLDSQLRRCVAERISFEGLCEVLETKGVLLGKKLDEERREWAEAKAKYEDAVRAKWAEERAKSEDAVRGTRTKAGEKLKDVLRREGQVRRLLDVERAASAEALARFEDLLKREGGEKGRLVREKEEECKKALDAQKARYEKWVRQEANERRILEDVIQRQKEELVGLRGAKDQQLAGKETLEGVLKEKAMLEDTLKRERLLVGARDGQWLAEKEEMEGMLRSERTMVGLLKEKEGQWAEEKAKLEGMLESERERVKAGEGEWKAKWEEEKVRFEDGERGRWAKERARLQDLFRREGEQKKRLVREKEEECKKAVAAQKVTRDEWAKQQIEERRRLEVEIQQLKEEVERLTSVEREQRGAKERLVGLLKEKEGEWAEAKAEFRSERTRMADVKERERRCTEAKAELEAMVESERARVAIEKARWRGMLISERKRAKEQREKLKALLETERGTLLGKAAMVDELKAKLDEEQQKYKRLKTTLNSAREMFAGYEA